MSARSAGTVLRGNECLWHDEAGVSLVLALVMLIRLSFIFLALASSSINDIANSTNLNGSAHRVRHKWRGPNGSTDGPLLGEPFSPTTAQSCLPGTGDGGHQRGHRGRLLQQSAYNQNLSDTRVINFYACSPGPGAPTCTSTNALLYANVTFDDYPLNGGSSDCTYGGSRRRAGPQEHVNSWIVESGNNG